MPERLKLIVAYDGTPFAGWQSQAHRNTVQDHLEKAFAQITGTEVRVHGAGRTDTGVHALGQCAHVDVPDRNWSVLRWTAAVNGLLPPTIRIIRSRYVSKNFHARFDATGKTYRYRIWATPVLPPLEFGRACHVIAPFDFALFARTAQKFTGKHDFAAFAAQRGKPETSTVRTIRSIRARKTGALIILEVDGDGFLYKMVRLMAGSLIRCACGKMPAREIVELLHFPGQGHACFSAPAAGLILVRVRY